MVAKSRRQYVSNYPALAIARGLPEAKGAPFPKFIEPSLATLTAKPPEGGRWVHEIKYDGSRLQLHVQQGTVKCLTRRGHDWTDRFNTIVGAAWHLKAHTAVIDG